ncbi:Suppressor of profilin deletion-like protein [Escovopsis weberi]|uniref:Suppressor of profilin deletion-like protein n=1 Tax=Escovopsis weberi TaxID=150374 RepID=A0A0M9VV00_ESCWE|nr:Suppressor of profilin deletion-like protein [Escovopsis weberi]
MDMARAEYPAMLHSRDDPTGPPLLAVLGFTTMADHGAPSPAALQQALLQPGQAVFTLNDRVKRINKLNIEIADWLQERRRIEDQYVAGMRKLAQFKVPNAQSELGVFQGPWIKIVEAVERIANSHQQFAERIEKDVESPLRAFHQRRDMQNINNISNNLALMARDLEEAQERSDKLSKKGVKASTQKVDAASTKLESAQQQWDSQSPFVFETFQALDESRVNMIRDLLTQYQTHESDQAQRLQDTAVETLAVMLEVNTESEVHGFVQKVTQGKAQPSLRGGTRRSSTLGTQNSASAHGSAPTTPNPASQQVNEDDASEHNSLPIEGKPESKLRRLGTMFGGRRRQSMHTGFGQFQPQKSSGPTFGRLGSSHGLNSSQAAARVLSPRSSSSNLNEANRLSILAENPDANRHFEIETDSPGQTLNDRSNIESPAPGESLLDTPAPNLPTSPVNGNMPGIASPLEPTTSQPSQDASSDARDSEGFTIRAPMNDPISEAQRDISEEGDQPFKLNIQNQPIGEEDPEAAQAALSNVANTLKMGSATRRSVTMRGRRDARHTLFVPGPNLPESQLEGAATSAPHSPLRAVSHSRTSGIGLPSEGSGGTGGSDTQSVRSGTSFGSFSHVKHAEMTAPGLNFSIVEIVSAIFEHGVMKSASIAGEVACVMNPSETADPAKTHEVIRINNLANLERMVPNRIFVHNAFSDQPDQFSLDMSYPKQTATAFSYRVLCPESEPLALGSHAPLLLNSQWKLQGDKLGLLLQYQLNPESKLAGPVTLHNLTFVATYEGAASGAQTKPSGVHLKDKHMIYWRLGDVALSEAPQKIICRINGAEGVEPAPGQIEARWEYVPAAGDEGVVGSGISIARQEVRERDVQDADPFADADADVDADENLASSNPSLLEQAWVEVPTTRRLVSGKYEAR